VDLAKIAAAPASEGRHGDRRQRSKINDGAAAWCSPPPPRRLREEAIAGSSPTSLAQKPEWYSTAPIGGPRRLERR